MPSRADVDTIRAVLSEARLGSYERYLPRSGRSLESREALELYTWNVQISSAFLNPLHIIEVAVRNTASTAIELRYGMRWPWSEGFLRSLKKYPRGDLIKIRDQKRTTGEIIPELKFSFWQGLFVSRFHQRIWYGRIKELFPCSPDDYSEEDLRETLYNDLEAIRRFRNRIAHHEPIFKRNLDDDFSRISKLLYWRCPETASWMRRNQHVESLIQDRPEFD